HLEFPELVAAAELSAGPRTVVEVGCGAGNAIFPLLEQNRNPKLCIHAFNYSSHAIKLIQHNTLYTSPPCGTITASVWDLSSTLPPPDLAPRSADILVLVFVLSALHPSEWPQAISNIAQMLKPGRLLLMRDYGR
ncbi:S-adenosyl-L-methionine-dependent methyltransferase, partial [Lactarius pseudohatsudake]